MGDGGGSKKYGPWVPLGAGCISGGIEAVSETIGGSIQFTESVFLDGSVADGVY